MSRHRLGVAVKVLGDGGLPSHDTRRWQSGPHLRVSLESLQRSSTASMIATFRMYRMATELPSYASHPDLLSSIARSTTADGSSPMSGRSQWRRCGVPAVLDVLHRRCLDQARLADDEALRLALETWPPGIIPKVHYSSRGSKSQSRSVAAADESRVAACFLSSARTQI